jgi:hypothetical protein
MLCDMTRSLRTCNFFASSYFSWSTAGRRAPCMSAERSMRWSQPNALPIRDGCPSVRSSLWRNSIWQTRVARSAPSTLVCLRACTARVHRRRHRRDTEPDRAIRPRFPRPNHRQLHPNSRGTPRLQPQLRRWRHRRWRQQSRPDGDATEDRCGPLPHGCPWGVHLFGVDAARHRRARDEWPQCGSVRNPASQMVGRAKTTHRSEVLRPAAHPPVASRSVRTLGLPV